MSALKTQRSGPEVRKSEDVVTKAVHYPFWFGGSASCCATLFTHPLDLGKSYLSQLTKVPANNRAVKVHNTSNITHNVTLTSRRCGYKHSQQAAQS